jgi:DNA-binding Lrp family transcriptional regulator
VDTETLDELDRKLLQALQLDGRAPFSRIAAVLGVSDQTIARRYKRMRSSGNLRVLGMTDESRLGRTIWLIRLHCTPDGAERLAGALARRTDTSYVALISGGTEVTCAMRPRTDAARNEMLLDRLQHTPRVIGVSAHCVLHSFYGGPVGGLNKISALRAEEEAALQLPTPRPTWARVAVTDEDEALLSVLQRDGRAAMPELQTASGLSEDAVRRRLIHLRATGILYFEVQYAPELLGQHVTAMLWLSVSPAALSAVGTALAKHDEVNFAASVTGHANVFAVLVCQDTRQLYTYLSEQIGALDGVRSVETALVLRHIKRLALEPSRLPDAPADIRGQTTGAITIALVGNATSDLNPRNPTRTPSHQGGCPLPMVNFLICAPQALGAAICAKRRLSQLPLH